MSLSRILLAVFFIGFTFLYCDSSSITKYKYSKVIEIPNLSFLKNVYTGLDIFEQMDFNQLRNKSIAILTNQSAVNRNGRHILDILKRYPDIKIKFILSMEHGVWGTDDNRAKMIGRDEIEPLHNAQIINLFQTYLYPPRWVMENIDLVLVDFQDSGSRYPTYIATLSKVFEASSDYKVPIYLLDRPNPIRGDILEGPIPRLNYQSFESYHLLPIRHGLTLGEICIIINEMGWTKDSKRIQLNIVPLANWHRDTWFEDTKLIWRNPAPYLINNSNLLAYVGMNLFLGTNLNIGFGTETPYLVVGAPWLSTSFLIEKLNEKKIPGVEFEEIEYRPRGTIYHSRIPKYDNQKCSGIRLKIIDKNNFKPIATATTILMLIEQLHPRQFEWEENDYIDKLFGSNELRVFAAQKKPPDFLPSIWHKDIYKFNDFRQPFLIYK